MIDERVYVPLDQHRLDYERKHVVEQSILPAFLRYLLKRRQSQNRMSLDRSICSF